MNLANPTALMWAALAVPVIIFYILKIRLRRVPVSTVLFWRQVFEEKKPRSLWQRLRHLLSLLVQLAFLCLLIMALAQPFFGWEIASARRLVLVIDTSASMNATDVAPTRLEKARQLGQGFIDGLRHRDEMALIAAGTQPQVVCGLTSHQRTLRDALTALPASDGPTRVADAIALARRLIAEQKADEKHARVIVLTDGCSAGLEQYQDNDDVQVVQVGQRTGNVGITAFQVRRSLLDPIGYEILVEVYNHSDEPVECRLEMELNNEPVEVYPLKLEANGKWMQVFEKTSAEGGRLTAQLKHDDALKQDNEAVALLPKRELLPVTLVSETGNLFVEKVLEASPLVRLTVQRKPSAQPRPGVITVYHHDVPKVLPPGPALVIDPNNDCDLWKVGAALQNPLVAKQDHDSPLMAHVRLDNVLMPEARKLTFTPAAGKPLVLASTLTGDPLYAAIDRPDGKVLVLSVNLDKGDLPLRTAFPILATNALGWFAGSKGELHEALATGATTEVSLPAHPEGGFVLRSPDGQTRPLPPNVRKTIVGPLDQCGVWVVLPAEQGATPVQEIACNLANVAESDVRSPELPAASAGETSVSWSLGGHPLWFYLLVAGFLLVVTEWYLYQRRWIS